MTSNLEDSIGVWGSIDVTRELAPVATVYDQKQGRKKMEIWKKSEEDERI